jgi:pyruvate formate lyase activating enzyme
VSLCPQGLRKISGTVYTPEELTKRLLTYAPFFGSDGGVTFSGGEPTYQPDFLCETLDLLGKAGIHRAVQTCGYCSESVFSRVLDRVDFVLFDIKHTDPDLHKFYTGVDNAPILANLERLKRSGIPFIARVPLIAGVNDDAVNLTKTAELLTDATNLQRVELLPYNGAAGAKYKMVGLPFEYDFRAPERVDTSVFTERGIECRTL